MPVVFVHTPLEREVWAIRSARFDLYTQWRCFDKLTSLHARPQRLAYAVNVALAAVNPPPSLVLCQVDPLRHDRSKTWVPEWVRALGCHLRMRQRGKFREAGRMGRTAPPGPCARGGANPGVKFRFGFPELCLVPSRLLRGSLRPPALHGASTYACQSPERRPSLSLHRIRPPTVIVPDSIDLG